MTVIITDDHQGVSTVLSGHQTVRQLPTRSPPPRAASARGDPPSSVHLPHPPPPQPPSPGETYQCGNFGRRQVHHRPIQVAVHVGGVPKYRRGGGHAQGQIGREGERHGAARTPRGLAQGKGGGQGRDPKKNQQPRTVSGGGLRAAPARHISNHQATAAAGEVERRGERDAAKKSAAEDDSAGEDGAGSTHSGRRCSSGYTSSSRRPQASGACCRAGPRRPAKTKSRPRGPRRGNGEGQPVTPGAGQAVYGEPSRRRRGTDPRGVSPLGMEAARERASTGGG